jgi:hypothetical protein
MASAEYAGSAGPEELSERDPTIARLTGRHIEHREHQAPSLRARLARSSYIRCRRKRFGHRVAVMTCSGGGRTRDDRTAHPQRGNPRRLATWSSRAAAAHIDMTTTPKQGSPRQIRAIDA